MNYIDLIQSNLSNFIIAVIIGVLTFILSNVYKSVFKYFKNLKYHNYRGIYNYYHYSTNKNPELLKGTLKIRFGLFKSGVYFEDSGFKFSGNFKCTNRNIFISLNGITHEEQLLLVFNEPLFIKNKTELIGVAACITDDGEPCAKKVVISLEELPQSQLEKMLCDKNKKPSFIYID